MLLQSLEKRGLIHPPPWMTDNTQYLCIVGSHAYGVANADSDWDLLGWCIPPKDVVFPHLHGRVEGFGTPRKNFEQFQEHGIVDEELRKEYDVTVHSVIKFMNLAMECNSTFLEALFVPMENILHSTIVGNLLRDSRHLFLSKLAFHKLSGYARSQFHKMRSKEPVGKRKDLRERMVAEGKRCGAMDVKFAMNCVRLSLQCQQILEEGELDLQRNKDFLKEIRRGEVTEEEIRKWYAAKEVQLTEIYTKSKLPDRPQEKKIKALLLKVLEHHYGSLEKCVVDPNEAVTALREVQEVLEKHSRLLNR
jgi:predicted nucleotidyltransferase